MTKKVDDYTLSQMYAEVARLHGKRYRLMNDLQDIETALREASAALELAVALNNDEVDDDEG